MAKFHPHERDAEAAAMLCGQLQRRGITDERVLAAMRCVPRHRFVPEYERDRAYEDAALALSLGQTISQPYVVAMMTQWLEVEPGMRVLEVGTGSGYQAAILAELGATVVTLERHAALAAGAETALASLGYGDRVTVVTADGTLGWPAGGPYHRIIVTAASPSLPPPLRGQLTDPGRIVIPIGEFDEQTLVAWDLKNGQWKMTEGIGVRFVPLVGQHAWQF